jgi:hypothetical protein
MISVTVDEFAALLRISLSDCASAFAPMSMSPAAMMIALNEVLMIIMFY